MKIFIILLLLGLPALAGAQTCIQADNNHPDSATLTWTDNSTDESGFILERKQDAGAYAVIASAIGANLISWIDGTVKRGSVPTTYTYRIKAYRDVDKVQSPYSNESCITFAPILPPQPKPLQAPGGLTTAAVSSSTFRITWEDLTDEIGYELEGKQARGNESFVQIASLPINTATYDWTGRKRYTPYCVRLRGLNSGGATPYTQSVCATTSK